MAIVDGRAGPRGANPRLEAVRLLPSGVSPYPPLVAWLPSPPMLGFLSI